MPERDLNVYTSEQGALCRIHGSYCFSRPAPVLDDLGNFQWQPCPTHGDKEQRVRFFTPLIHALQEHKESFDQRKIYASYVQSSDNKETNLGDMDQTTKERSYIPSDFDSSGFETSTSKA